MTPIISSDDYPEEEKEEIFPNQKNGKATNNKRKHHQQKRSKSKQQHEDDFESLIEEASKQQAARRKKVLIKKYTANGTLPLHESVIIGNEPTFVSLAADNGRKPQFFRYVEGLGDIDFYPSDSVDSHNPIPYCYETIDDLKGYIELAKQETFETLLSKVKSTFKKYVNVEEHYASILSADIIYSYFQDKFGTTHYNILVGDNGSGKNSALLVCKHLAYRVFYVVGASAPNYFTFLGDLEECQGTIAEDEADDIAYDKDKNKVVRTGYCSGATVPKVDLSFGRKQDSWLTYCHKWFAMEELPDYKKIKGILDRSFVYNFVVGKVDYNIKDVTRHCGDQTYKSLYEEITALENCYLLLGW